MLVFNSYADAGRAEAYSKMEFPGTYYLAYRDLPEIFSAHVNGKKAMDFGCGTGRSTRFLEKHGFDTVGVDISADMLKIARKTDPNGDYRLIDDGDPGQFGDNTYDLILSAFTFDNIPTMEKKLMILSEMGRVLKPEGRFVNLVSSPEIYVNEWASFSTRDFPGNWHAKSGDVVKIIQTDTEDKRPVDDIICTDEDYRELFNRAGLEIVNVHKPLAREDEPYQWINETKIAPWVIYVLKHPQGVFL